MCLYMFFMCEIAVLKCMQEQYLCLECSEDLHLMNTA